MDLPPELPKPLAVGQEVTARHPATRQLHDGTILTCTGSKYRVQFNRGDLMTEVVKDVDVMPSCPAENLPPAMNSAALWLNGRPTQGPASRRKPQVGVEAHRDVTV